MSVEGSGGDNSPKKTSRLTQFEQAEFVGGMKLTGDSFNLWKGIQDWSENKADCEACGVHFRGGTTQTYGTLRSVLWKNASP
jgi:hypothetical protein